MNSSQIILFSISFLLTIFAIYFEIIDQKNAYFLGKATDKDSLSRSINKLDICLSYDLKTVKWRLTFIVSNILIILIFGLIQARVPSAQEYLLYFLFIFIVYNLLWYSYVSRTATEAVRYSRENITNIKKTLRKTRTFILPW